MKDKLKKQGILTYAMRIVRAITVPPVLVSVLLVLLYFFNDSVFSLLSQLVFSLIFLVVVPLLAYPLASALPQVKKLGREGQRKLAFVFSLLGYTLSVVYGLIAQVSTGLLLIFLTYFLSALILTLFNKVFKVRASGHACGTLGPLIFLIYFTGFYAVVPCVLIAFAVVWSSLHLKRHRPHELVWGAVIALVSFIVALLSLGIYENFNFFY